MHLRDIDRSVPSRIREAMELFLYVQSERPGAFDSGLDLDILRGK